MPHQLSKYRPTFFAIIVLTVLFLYHRDKYGIITNKSPATIEVNTEDSTYYFYSLPPKAVRLNFRKPDQPFIQINQADTAITIYQITKCHFDYSDSTSNDFEMNF